MGKTYEIVNKTIKLKKDCVRCDKIKVCKFHAKMSELCKSNEFYSMTEYLEWNNSLKAFEQHSSCQYFKNNFTVPKDGTVMEDIINDRDIRDSIISIELGERFPDFRSYSYDKVKGEITCNFKNSDETQSIILTIGEMIKDYKFI